MSLLVFFRVWEVRSLLLKHYLVFLSSEDREISKALKSILAKRGMDIKTKTTVKEINLKDGKVEVILNSGENIEKILVEKVVITIGRKPQINNLGLENAGIFL
ncbi:MAG: Dihydrolipoyl dehydrogenase [Candidatus Methanoperedenaceae archaeon GB50]|nr:MAG: Dihydrolipoyl dehydrogenase [Candidatus Methanoperedenaceae archaeon GB50]